MTHRFTILTLCGLLFIAPAADCSIRIEATDGEDLGHVQNVVGNWTKRDEVTAILPASSILSTGIFCGGDLTTTRTCESFRGRQPRACTLTRIDATVTTAPAGSTIIIDLLECTTVTSCTSVWAATPSNRLEINTGQTRGFQTTFNDTAIALGNFLAFDVVQIGSTTAGAGLTVNALCE